MHHQRVAVYHNRTRACPQPSSSRGTGTVRQDRGAHFATTGTAANTSGREGQRIPSSGTGRQQRDAQRRAAGNDASTVAAVGQDRLAMASSSTLYVHSDTCSRNVGIDSAVLTLLDILDMRKHDSSESLTDVAFHPFPAHLVFNIANSPVY